MWGVSISFCCIGYFSFINKIDREQKGTKAHVGGALARLGRLRPEVPRKLALWGGPKLHLRAEIGPESECAPRLQ